MATWHVARNLPTFDPEPDVIALLPELEARGARTALDFGCGVGQHALACYFGVTP